MFTGIDFITTILMLSGVLTGIVRGFVGNLIDIIGICAGISLASIVYRAPVTLFKKFGINRAGSSWSYPFMIWKSRAIKSCSFFSKVNWAFMVKKMEYLKNLTAI